MSPVHVVLVSLLVNQLFGLFLNFFGLPKKIVQSQGILVSLWEFLVHQKEIWSTKKNFGTPKRNLVDQKFPETDQKLPETGQFFLVDQKK